MNTFTINKIRLLSVDGVAEANSGHTGAPLGLAAIGHVLMKNMKFNLRIENTWIALFYQAAMLVLYYFLC
ncbi:unnamed protein product [Debaryomyces fabryi]|nr:unnamed protein product [Debaryomyces fabryi]